MVITAALVCDTAQAPTALIMEVGFRPVVLPSLNMMRQVVAPSS